ncbi:hypothetical protein [Thalassotalea sp. ND16A]|uniref:hypothetical protein n=1 Tax=Thalassotalea sp. ND16A TaxID=1535422 RepID=UPI00051A3E2D|nr:hypothetical protein [Thalassotalea sp. ND16A]KGJ89477.1 hypothetical protein ND16A_2370 [Thalassotalea sp. ND16A]
MEFKKILSVLLFSSLFISGISVSAELEKLLRTVEQITALEADKRLAKNQGFLLIKLNVNHDAASINFAKIRKKRASYIFDKKTLKLGQKYLLNLKNADNEFYLIPLLAGGYQITRVNAPFYNLPYWRPTKELASWRFHITPGKINYAGEVSISAERGTDFINVNLLNRFATDQQQIQVLLTDLSAQFPLVGGSGYRDDFATEWEAE